MKLDDIVEPQRIDEINLKQAIAAGLIGASSLSPKTTSAEALPPPPKPAVVQQQQTPAQTQAKKEEAEAQDYVDAILANYKVTPKFAEHVVKVADKYSYPDFPTTKQVLAVIGVESKFKPHAMSKLRHDPAMGLMQVRAQNWHIKPHLLLKPEINIKHGVQILRRYYEKLGSEAGALQAYNIGITRYRHGHRQPRYLHKVKEELAKF